MQISSLFLTVLAVAASSVYASPAPALQEVSDGYCWLAGCEGKQEKDCSFLGDEFKSTPVYSDGKLKCTQCCKGMTEVNE